MYKNIDIDCNNVLTCVENFYLSNLLLFIGCTKNHVIYVAVIGTIAAHARKTRLRDAHMTHRDVVAQTYRRCVSAQKFIRVLLFTFRLFSAPPSLIDLHTGYIYVRIVHMSCIHTCMFNP